MPSRVFETSFGHKIRIDENYGRYLPQPPNRADVVHSSSIQQSGGIKAPRESDYGITSDIFQFAMMADWLERTEVGDRRFDRMLDIGGSTGLIGQFFKAVGRARTVENIEILDFRDQELLGRVRHFLRLIQAGRKNLYEPSRISKILNRTRWVRSQLDFMQDAYPYPIDQHSNYWRISPDAPLGLDKYILGDLFELDEKYDFLLSATTMHHFSVPLFLRKAHSLLAPGGVLLIWNCYWYWAMIISGVFGHFPWAVQRLTGEDFTRYQKEYQPDQVETARTALEAFHKGEKRYTINDYVAAGKEAGFKYLDHHRLTPFSGIHNQMGAWRLEGDHGIGVQKEVLRDIHCFRKDVELIDLSTHSVFLLLQKE